MPLGQRNMDESQVQSALTLLNKLLPDLSLTQLTSDADSPLASTAVELANTARWLIWLTL